ncbi:MAG: flagellar basal-body rod protein FlgF [Alphaproteobacteria bacterium]
MNNTLYISLSRQTALWRQLDVVANNMANMNTTAFKADNSLFSQYLVKTPNGSTPDKTLAFTQDYGLVEDFSEGPMSATSNPLDVAIHGDGFFVLEGSDGETYSRDGQFKLNSDGMLVNSDNLPVLSTNNAPIFLAPNEQDIEIARDGTVSTENGEIGKIKIVAFEDNQKLTKTYGSLYATTKDNPAKEVETVNVEQGMLEQSNVQPINEITKMISLQRSYGNVQQMIDSEYERLGKAIDVLSARANR